MVDFHFVVKGDCCVWLGLFREGSVSVGLCICYYSYILMRNRIRQKANLADVVKMSEQYKIASEKSYSQIYEHALVSSQFQSLQKRGVELPKIHLSSKRLQETILIVPKSLKKASLKPINYKSLDDSTFRDKEKQFFFFQSLHSSNRTSEVKKPTNKSKRDHKDSIMPLLQDYNLSEIEVNKRIKFKAYVQEGNNSRLIKELLRRRNVFQVAADKKEANFVWTRNLDYETSQAVTKFSINPVRPKLQDGLNTTLDMDKMQSKPKSESMLQVHSLKLHNHFRHHHQLSDKKCLFKNIRAYCKQNSIREDQVIPHTYHMSRTENPGLPQQEHFDEGMWIIKPGEDTNQGNNIFIASGRDEIIKAMDKVHDIGKTAIVQRYISPLLYKGRKFDIRCYLLAVSYLGQFKAYWYREGYLRTCSKEYSTDKNIYRHLTNDAIQKQSKQYGKYEPCNKLSYGDLETLLDQNNMSMKKTVGEMKQIAYWSVKAVESKIVTEKNVLCFEIFGYDFLIDEKGKAWLIEVNTNPCLEFEGSLLSRIIWHMVDNAFSMVIDPFIQRESPKEDRRQVDNRFERLV